MSASAIAAAVQSFRDSLGERVGDLCALLGRRPFEPAQERVANPGCVGVLGDRCGLKRPFLPTSELFLLCCHGVLAMVTVAGEGVQ